MLRRASYAVGSYLVSDVGRQNDFGGSSSLAMTRLKLESDRGIRSLTLGKYSSRNSSSLSFSMSFSASHGPPNCRLFSMRTPFALTLT
jgi:hypothetical protein